jgi:heme exporter protein C
VTSQSSHRPGAGPIGDATVVEGPAGGPRGTGSKGTRILGIVTLAAIALGAYLALVSTPPDANMGNAVRLLYLHVPVVTVAYTAASLVTVASVMFLWKKSMWWDVTAAASAELAFLFTCLTLVSGAIWGKPTWGTYWVWDPRLTATAMLALLLLGYLAVRRLPGQPSSRAKRAAIVGLLVLPNVFLDNRAVTWWRSVHQGTTVLQTLQPKIHDQMAFALYYNLLVGFLLFAWLLIHRWRLAWLEQQVEAAELDEAIAERRAEGEPTRALRPDAAAPADTATEGRPTRSAPAAIDSLTAPTSSVRTREEPRS